MSQHHADRKPATAAEEVLAEVEDAETEITDPDEPADHSSGNRADATTPNQDAQESVGHKDRNS